MFLHALVGLGLVSAAGAVAPQINPVAPVTQRETLAEWTFASSTEGWEAQHHCTLSAGAGLLKIEVTGDDPYLHRRVDLPGGDLLLEMKVRRTNTGPGGVYWTTDRSPVRGEDKAKGFPIPPQRQWHDAAVRFTAPGTLTDLRIDPGNTSGEFEIDSLRLVHIERHPLTVDRVDVGGRQVRFTLKNHRTETVAFSAAGQTYTAAPEGTLAIDRPIRGDAPVEAVSLKILAEGFPPLERTVFVHNPGVETEWLERPVGEFTLQVARDGSAARLKRGGRLAAVLGPLVDRGGKIPTLGLVAEDPAIRFRGDGIDVVLAVRGQQIDVSIASDKPCEGPVVRAVGPLEQGLFAGLEYLGQGERSSSTLDVETEAHLRFAPDPLKVTMPLMALLTDRVSLAMTWTDMRLQPVFATPNFFDATPDHRMALRGTKIDATIRAGRDPLEEAIAWAARSRGLPPLPEPPRRGDKQLDFCLRGLSGPLKTDQGWGHCVESRWARHPFADMASTVWRLTGQVPDLPKLVPGGAHVRNDAVYFVTGRVEEWKEIRAREVRGILNRQQPDGSFRYAGRYRRGHFEDTASGVCATPAATLLEYARLTGDHEALEAGVRTLEYMKRFRTPRGAQVWEVPLHTPDLLASASLVRAYVRGYELTGDRRYLVQARKWALSGVPFVYLWGRYPVMLYATPPVFGATNWKAPCWIGLPVQWVGLVYAYALSMLAPHDETLDWAHLARGILTAGQQMQYPDGPYAGLLPDAFDLSEQHRRPWTINPCALVSLQLVLDGRLDSLSVAAGENHRVVAPYPVAIRGGQAHVHARPGATYQVLIDGARIVDVVSVGDDVVSLE